MAEVIKLITPPKTEVVEQLPHRRDDDTNELAAPVRFFDDPNLPTQSELLAVARDHDRKIKAPWAI